MEKEKLIEFIKKARENNKRNFTQTFDLIINIKDIDFKKPENQFEYFLTLPYQAGKKKTICALVGGEMREEAKAADKVILVDDFKIYQEDKKKAKHLAKECDIFIAQANLMANIATAFGKVLGPRGKMPNPKAGAVFPPKTNLAPIIEKLQKTIKISVKRPQMQCTFGNDKMTDEQLAENLMAIYNSIISHFPGEKNNIKELIIKTTMGKPIKIE